jgi:hypothetical protein
MHTRTSEHGDDHLAMHIAYRKEEDSLTELTVDEMKCRYLVRSHRPPHHGFVLPVVARLELLTGCRPSRH